MKTDLTEISPFTDKKSVIVEKTDSGIETRICMDTGFTTSTEYKLNSDKIEEIERTTSKLIKDLRFSDHVLGQYWYPTTAMFSTGVIYPDGTVEDWKWVYAPIVTMDEEEQKKYPVPGKSGEYYQTRVATDVAEYYGKEEFRAICKRVGMAKDIETPTVESAGSTNNG
jgi:hypothetical protein